jgi:hypothetical protein
LALFQAASDGARTLSWSVPVRPQRVAPPDVDPPEPLEHAAAPTSIAATPAATAVVRSLDLECAEVRASELLL